jgi:hypothetical protein
MRPWHQDRDTSIRYAIISELLHFGRPRIAYYQRIAVFEDRTEGRVHGTSALGP